MRTAPNLRLEQHRLDGPPNTTCGAFLVGPLRVLIGDGMGWDHVSVSRADRCPTWDEMDKIKRMCFRDDEIVMQLHINDARKIDRHPYCLHLWRPQTTDELAATRAAWGEEWPYGDLAAAGAIPLPPAETV